MMARIIEEAEASIREFPRPAPQEQLKVRKPWRSWCATPRASCI